MSIDLINQTPYLSAAWDYLNKKGDPYGVALLRGRFLLKAINDKDQSWLLMEDTDQGELFTEDHYFDKPGRSSVRYESDFIPYKSGTDIVANAVARSPEGVPRKQWRCGITIEDTQGRHCCQKILNVTGPRQWNAGLLLTTLSQADSSAEVKIRYEHAYGGSTKQRDGTEKDDDYYAPNPVGVGRSGFFDGVESWPAPQIESPNDPICSPSQSYEPQGLGFVSRLWQPRMSLGGSYDEIWLKDKHPLLPDDFDLDYFRSASPELALSGYLQGNEIVMLNNFSYPHDNVRFHLPNYSFYSSLVLGNGGFLLQPLHLDTVLLDIEQNDPQQWRIYLSWRGQHIVTDSAEQLELFGVDNSLTQENKMGQSHEYTESCS
ncbi:MAG: hypothetical protein CSB47_11625 [Proteobacteria bacterium]|nr:MAG: hypothetical protein CSB47_11625 [Pseudomonadota bacterium]